MSNAITWAKHLVVTMLGAILVSTTVMHIADGLITPGEHLLLLSSCILLSSTIVFIPYAMEDPAEPSHQLLPIITTALCTLLIIDWHTPFSLVSPMLWKITFGLCLLIFTLTAIAGLLARLACSHNSITLWITLLLLITSSAPIWLGPAVESLNLGQSTINAIIAASPLSYLAVLADWDYLRGEWFYRNTPFGGLRFNYPSAPVSTTLYLAIGLLCHYIRRKIKSDISADASCIEYQSSHYI